MYNNDYIMKHKLLVFIICSNTMMKCLIVLSALLGNLSAFSFFGQESDHPTLKLVHMLFRHGNRNPDNGSIIVGSPYYDESYYPEGYGQLTNTGKLREYDIGKALHKRYSNFLTETWKINYLDVRTTDFNRTKMSAELMLAALYPPRRNQIWSFVNWQPVPYNYYPRSKDKETQGWNACNTRWATLLNDITNTPEIADYLLRYKELFEILSYKTGETIDIYRAANYYFGFVTQHEIGYPLEKWTQSVYPEPIHSAAVDFYYLITNTTSIRRIMAGYLLKKILSDTERKINGTISPSTRKMFIYSAHEINIASMVLSLGGFKITDIPPYGSYVLFEVHEIKQIWGIKLFYQNYDTIDPIPMKLPGCNYFCPYEDFYNLVEEILPEDDTDCYGSSKVLQPCIDSHRKYT